ncbi:MAG TPA: hypothetical protein DDX11_04525 [Candidatus Peribacter riflensis]|nr:hypothetical protein [Candidatus Peribacter riflensis]
MQWNALAFRLFLHRLSLYLLPAGVLLCLVLPGLHGRVLAGEGGVVISEVLWMGSDLSTSDEWVELACFPASDCDLSGWSLTSLKSSGEEAIIIAFATGTVLSASEARVISNFPATSSRLASDPWMTTTAMALPNTKLLLRLRDAAGVIRDEVDDGVGNPFAGANPSGGPKASMERIDLSASGNIPENWRTAVASLGFKDGSPIFGTPGEIALDRGREGPLSSASSASSQASLTSSTSSTFFASSSSGSFMSSESSSSLDYARDDTAVSSASSASSASSSSFVLITEVLANPIGADTDEWIEIANLGAGSVNIAGWVLDDGNSSAEYIIPPRSGADFFLLPGEHVSFRKSQTALPLDNSGERVSLMSGSMLIDAFAYPLTAEEVSFGRDPNPPFALHAFCVPSEGRKNVSEPLAPRIIIQDAGAATVGSAFVVGEGHVTLNLQAALGAGSLASAACVWDFGDDAVSSACNPSSHTFSDPGDYAVRLTVRDFCGGISVSTLDVTVLPEEESVVHSSVSSASSISSVSSLSFSSSISSISSLPFIRVETGVILSEVQMMGDEWIELWNPTDHEISLGGWMLDDLREGGLAHRSSKSGGGSKPWKLPVDSRIRAGEYLIFSRNETKLQLNDSGDDVWLIAPDGSWSDHVTIPKLKSGISFSFCDGEWRSSDPTPELPNACQTTVSSPAPSIAVTKKSIVATTPAFSRTRYVVASQSSISSISFSSFQSGSFLMSYALSELPATLTAAGPVAEQSSVPEVGALGALSGLGIALMWFGRKWWGL